MRYVTKVCDKGKCNEPQVLLRRVCHGVCNECPPRLCSIPFNQHWHINDVYLHSSCSAQRLHRLPDFNTCIRMRIHTKGWLFPGNLEAGTSRLNGHVKLEAQFMVGCLSVSLQTHLKKWKPKERLTSQTLTSWSRNQIHTAPLWLLGVVADHQVHGWGHGGAHRCVRPAQHLDWLLAFGLQKTGV